MNTCPDCGAHLGEKHKDGCDVERCPHCGGQALGCVGFDPHDPRRQAWDGRWPGEADCERLGFFVNGDRSLPDLNATDRIFMADGRFGWIVLQKSFCTQDQKF